LAFEARLRRCTSFDFPVAPGDVTTTIGKITSWTVGVHFSAW
jgi:hypothetical protein